MLKRYFYNDENIGRFKTSMEKLFDDPEQTLKDDFGLSLGHTDIHIPQYDEEKIKYKELSRIISGTSGDGHFLNKEDAYDLIANALYNCQDIVVAWLAGKEGNISIDDAAKAVATKKDLELTVYMGETCGISYEAKHKAYDINGNAVIVPNKNGVIKIKESQAIKIILEADNNKENELYTKYGFYIKTAYPETKEIHAKEIGEISRKDIVNKNLAAFHSSMQKAAFLHESNKLGAEVQLNDRDGEESIRITQMDNHQVGKYVAYIAEDKTRFYEYNENGKGKHTITPDNIKTLSPDFYNLATNIKENYDRLQRGEEIQLNERDEQAIKSHDDKYDNIDDDLDL